MNANNVRLFVLVVIALIGVSPASGADVPYLTGGVGVDERQQLLDIKIIATAAPGAR